MQKEKVSYHQLKTVSRGQRWTNNSVINSFISFWTYLSLKDEKSKPSYYKHCAIACHEVRYSRYSFCYQTGHKVKTFIFQKPKTIPRIFHLHCHFFLPSFNMMYYLPAFLLSFHPFPFLSLSSLRTSMICF